MARKRIAAAAATIIVPSVVAALIAGAPATAAKKQRVEFNGSWNVTIAGGPGTPPLPFWYGARMTAVAGGGLIATVTDPNITTGHGSWARVGKRSFAVTILLSQFNSGGEFQGTLKASATLRLDKKARTFESNDYRFQFLDRNGVPTFSGVGSARGTRIGIER